MKKPYELDVLIKYWGETAIRHKLNPADVVELYKAALEVRENAYAPYSKFRVGASARTISGQIFSGCNIENSSFGATVCAERTAIFKAVSAGDPQISYLAVIAEYETPVPPCGLCRQVLSEFGINAKVLMGNLSGDTLVVDFGDILPYTFSLNQGC